jgi:hypothetical protein
MDEIENKNSVYNNQIENKEIPIISFGILNHKSTYPNKIFTLPE